MSSQEALLQIIENLKRRLRNSRSRVSRNLENCRRKEIKAKTTKEAKRSVELINNFRKDTTWCREKLCYKCKQNINNGEKITIEEVTVNLAHVDERDILKLRRFESYFCCQDCSNKKTTNFQPNIEIQSLSHEDKTFFVPSALLTTQNDDPTWLSNSPESSAFVCIFPSTLEALHHISTDRLKSRTADAAIIYHHNPNLRDIFSIAYENELYKFKRAKCFGDRYQGTLKGGNDNALASVSRVPQDHRVVGSDTWVTIERDISQRRMEQNGAICISLSVTMPVQQDVIASSLIQSGLVLSVEYVGSSTSELQTKYFVHNHGPDVDCDESCTKQIIDDYLPGILDLSRIGTTFIGTHLNSIQMKMQSFIRHYLKDEDSSIHSEDYSIRICYKLNGEIIMNGYFWPKQLEQLNLEYPKYPVSQLDPQIVSDAIQFIDSQISNSTKASVLQSQFNLSEFESRTLAELARKVQHKLCEQTLPAIDTDFTVCPSSEFWENISAAKEFRKIMMKKLTAANSEDYEMSTVGWLSKVLEGVKINESAHGIWTISIENVSIRLLPDTRLLNMSTKYPKNPILGIYNYCLTCFGLGESFQVVLKTVALIDTYTKPYHKDLLRSFQSEMEISPVNGYCKERALACELDTCPEIEKLCENATISHRALSLAEVVSLLDKNVQRTANSTSSEYISARSDWKTYFKKVSSETENTFTADGATGFFEKISSNIEKYFSRRNGAHVTLAEFCMFYDYLGSEESRQLIKVFSKKDAVSINDSEKRSVVDKSKFLPQLIVTNNEEVLKIRSNSKIITYPEFEESSKHQYQRVLMFLPLSTEPRDEEVLALFNKKDGNDDGVQTIVDRVER